MRRFTELYTHLDATTATHPKVAAMRDYFAAAPPADAAWAVSFLCGRRIKRLIPGTRLREWVAEAIGMPMWLVEESYSAVGDSAETMTLLLDEIEAGDAGLDVPLHAWVENRILPLKDLDESEQKARLLGYWRELPTDARFTLNKLLTGAFRVGVSRRLVTRALAEVADIEPARVAHRLMGRWQPTPEFFERLVDPADRGEDAAQPYPFFLASPIENAPIESISELGPVADWQAEWKWDGIRAQIIRRAGECHIWSRGEDLMEGRFPELEAAAAALPNGSVLDGEILAWVPGEALPLPFARLQRRIGRLKPSANMQKKHPVRFFAYDLMEYEGADIRERPLEERRALLADALAGIDERIALSEHLAANSWDELAALRERSREFATEGFVLKRRGSPYRVGRVRGDWWKWKVDPYAIDAVLLYAQPGSGRRSNLLTDYTFAVWDGDELVPFAKAYSGLTDKEIRQVDSWIRKNTKERFGPVRSVTPYHVFELHFEGIQASNRHKSGIAVRFPRIARWRTDKPLAEADTLDNVKALLPPNERADLG
ncbi:ATP-dependent DNA ligase [Salinisphaera hydrothermalis]|uniref:DNA ligase (ATP) n=1 Tax=Salinisphaera hydrothermalis (strain C41B8) TaxID=1304275 RepID=A0A084IJD6_SALHC|nr:ATP-dependent DNA ligase [Salinisphaera hydrothermalis]KEZ76820.1 DNA ligase, ATP-dependent [Salinisphaera hydrothermalis C41B8]